MREREWMKEHTRECLQRRGLLMSVLSVLTGLARRDFPGSCLSRVDIERGPITF